MRLLKGAVGENQTTPSNRPNVLENVGDLQVT